MNDYPQDVIDEVNGAQKEDGSGAPNTVAGPADELVPETKSASAQDGQPPQILSPDQQAVMHRISEAIAMLVYDQASNKPVITMALQGAAGMVNAISIVVGKVAESAKPGVPRELLPMAALAALMILSDFVERIGQQPPEMREVLPALIDKLGTQFQATPAEMAQMRRIKAKFGRAHERSLMEKNMGVPQAQEAAEEATEGAQPQQGGGAPEGEMGMPEGGMEPSDAQAGKKGIMARVAEEDL